MTDEGFPQWKKRRTKTYMIHEKTENEDIHDTTQTMPLTLITPFSLAAGNLGKRLNRNHSSWRPAKIAVWNSYIITPLQLICSFFLLLYFSLRFNLPAALQSVAFVLLALSLVRWSCRQCFSLQPVICFPSSADNKTNKLQVYLIRLTVSYHELIWTQQLEARLPLTTA